MPKTFFALSLFYGVWLLFIGILFQVLLLLINGCNCKGSIVICWSQHFCWGFGCPTMYIDIYLQVRFWSVAVTDLFPLANQCLRQAIRPHTDQSGEERIDSFFPSRTIFPIPFWKPRQVREHGRLSLKSTLLVAIHTQKNQPCGQLHDPLATVTHLLKTQGLATLKRTFSHSDSFTSAVVFFKGVSLFICIVN